MAPDSSASDDASDLIGGCHQIIRWSGCAVGPRSAGWATGCRWIAPSVSESGRPAPSQRRAMISAAIEIAVSSGVLAPRSSPIGDDSRRSSAAVRPASAQPGQPIGVGLAGAHRADVGDRQPQRVGQHRDVELRVVGQHADHRATVQRARIHLRPQVPVRPVDDHLVGLRETLAGGEHRPGIAHRHPVSEERPDPGHRGGEVDRPEHQHPRRGREAGDEDRQSLTAALAVRAVVSGSPVRPVASRPAGVVANGVVQPLAAEPAGGCRSVQITRCRPSWSGRPAVTVASATGSPAWIDAASAPNSGKVAARTASTKTSMIPPQVRPTVNASSSETPYRCSTGGSRRHHRCGRPARRRHPRRSRRTPIRPPCRPARPAWPPLAVAGRTGTCRSRCRRRPSPRPATSAADRQLRRPLAPLRTTSHDATATAATLRRSAGRTGTGHTSTVYSPAARPAPIGACDAVGGTRAAAATTVSLMTHSLRGRPSQLLWVDDRSRPRDPAGRHCRCLVGRSGHRRCRPWLDRLTVPAGHASAAVRVICGSR